MNNRTVGLNNTYINKTSVRTVHEILSDIRPYAVWALAEDFFYSDIHSILNSPLPLRVSHCGCTYASCQARWCECERKDIQLCARILGYSFCPTSVNIHFSLWNRLTDLFFDEHSVGNLRFRLPEPISAYNGSIDATSYGPACPQQKLTLPILEGLPAQIVDDIVNTVFTALFPDDEDCKIHLSFWTVYARWV